MQFAITTLPPIPWRPAVGLNAELAVPYPVTNGSSLMCQRYALAIILFSFVLPVSAAINQPDCDALASWADSFTPPKARTGPASIPEVFHAEGFAEIFGMPLDEWKSQDFRSLDGFMKDCQRQLFKSHRQKAKQINKVRKHVPSVQRAVEQARKAAPVPAQDVAASSAGDRRDTAVNIAARRSDAPSVASPEQARTDEPPSAEPARRATASAARGEPHEEGQAERQADLAKRMATAYASLQAFPFTQPADLGRYLRQLQALGRALADPDNAGAVAQSGLEREDVTALYEQRFLPAVDNMLPAFNQYLDNLPETAAGLKAAKRAVSRETGVRYSDDVMVDYIAAAERRAEAIQAVVDQAAAAERHAREHLDVSNRLDVLVRGDRVSRARLGEVTPGMSQDAVITFARDAWGYQAQPNMSLESQFGPPRKALKQFLAERRDGGQMTLRGIGDDVGQLEFVEHFQAKIELAAVRQQLVARFGEPGREQEIERGINWVWREGDRRMQVTVQNQVDVIMHGAGFRSRLAVALWNGDYEEYLVDASQRCSRIRKMPQSQRSMDDASFFMKHKCPMLSDKPLTPGLTVSAKAVGSS